MMHRRQAAPDRYARPRNRYIRGKAHYRAGNFNHALGLFRKVVEELTPEIAAIVEMRVGSDRTIDSITLEDVAALLRRAAVAGKPAESRDEWGLRILICGVTHDLAMILRQRAMVARRQNEPEVVEGVMQACAIACMADPWSSDPAHNVALYLRHLGDLDGARQFYQAALQLNPKAAESWVELGAVFAEVGDRAKSDACFDQALEAPATTADAIYNVSFVRLLKGDYATGWQWYEKRWESPDFVHGYSRAELAKPRWNGRATSRTVYLHQEQGIGDAIMMARYVPLVEDRVGRVILEVHSSAVSLFQAMFPHLLVIEKGVEPPPHHLQVPMLSLPALFGTTLQNVPQTPPFRLDSGETRPSTAEDDRIGLCWRGSSTHSNDRVRSMPFEATFPLLDVPGIRWQSLQFGADVEPPLEPCPTGDFLETARAIARCRLVITVDTSVAHLAGALGVPTWVLLPKCAEWRWLQDRSDCVWYPSAQLHRQERAGDWRSLTRRVAGLLTNRETIAA